MRTHSNVNRLPTSSHLHVLADVDVLAPM